MPEPEAQQEAIASPIDLLLAEQNAREVLVLSYTLNLNFWERHALSLARGLGAIVTVVGDAAMVSADPAHIRYAGITYLDGRAACRAGGAFHPKLVVLVGDDYAAIAVGSGNATVPGWHNNAELWTVIRGVADSAPTTFHELARWLQGLDRQVRFGTGVPDALSRVAERLLQLPATQAGPRVLSSLEQPIIDQLPTGPTEELTIAAPFHDQANNAVAALVKQLQRSRRGSVRRARTRTRRTWMASPARRARVLIRRRDEFRADACERHRRGARVRRRLRRGGLHRTTALNSLA